MNRKQARQLILILAAKQIPFKFRREESHYIIAFDPNQIRSISQAVGA